MADVAGLLSRIDAEFDAGRKKVAQFRSEQVQEFQARQRRLELFEQVCDGLREVWRPRLDALAQRFGENVKVEPQVAPKLREVSFRFKSELATIELRFSASTDADVRKLVIDYRLDVLPILMKFEPHARIEFELEAIDPDAIGRWIDDRILDFVRTYLSLHENEFYLKDHMVVDPAASKLERDGKTYYFVSDETRREFENAPAKS